MKERTVKIIYTFRWWRNDGEKHIQTDHIEYLDNTAEEHIRTMFQNGFTAGELIETLNEIEYRGWWERNTEVL